MAQAMTAPRPDASRAVSGVSPALDSVVVQAMAADPGDRYPDMARIRRALRALADAMPRRIPAVVVGDGRGRAGGGGRARLDLATRAFDPALGRRRRSRSCPFSASGPGIEFLGEGMVDLLATNFDGVGGIRTVDPRVAVRHWEVARTTCRAIGLATRFRWDASWGPARSSWAARCSAGTRVRLAADVYSTSGTSLGREQVEGPADSVLALVDRLSLALAPRRLALARPDSEPRPRLAHHRLARRAPRLSSRVSSTTAAWRSTPPSSNTLTPPKSTPPLRLPT